MERILKMKKTVIIIFAAIMLIGMTACNSSGVTQEEYDSVLFELNNLKNENTDSNIISQKEYESVVNELNNLKDNGNNLNKAFRPHINEFPASIAVASGWKNNYNDVFDFMFTMIPGDANSLYERPNFICTSNEEPASWLWLKLLEDENADTKGFELLDFVGGLYVSAIAIDDNQVDMQKTINELKNWVNEQENFELDFGQGRYQMTSRITSDETSEALDEALGYGQLEIFIPIKIK